jgi:hypothetical protein
MGQLALVTEATVKRDWDCIRAILLALEDKGDDTGYLRPTQIEGFDAETTAYNMKLLMQANLIERQYTQATRGNFVCVASSMKWDGHELLDKVKVETIWNRIKSAARERAIPLSFDAVKLLATEGLKSLVGGG